MSATSQDLQKRYPRLPEDPMMWWRIANTEITHVLNPIPDDGDVPDVAVELTPPEVIRSWVRGLKAAGIRGVRTAYLHGTALPRVVEFDCPFFHEGAVPGTYAKVRLLVGFGGVDHFGGLPRDPDGPIRPGTASCEKCRYSGLFPKMDPTEGFWNWLILCPGCVADAPTHPEHDPLDPRGWDYSLSDACRDRDPEAHMDPGSWVDDEPSLPGPNLSNCCLDLLLTVPSIDASPLAHVLRELYRAAGGHYDGPESPAGAGGGPEVEWSAESAAAWLDELHAARQAKDGDDLIPPTLGQSAVWQIVRDVDGRPSQAMVRAGQALRKTGATED